MTEMNEGKGKQKFAYREVFVFLFIYLFELTSHLMATENRLKSSELVVSDFRQLNISAKLLVPAVVFAL